MDRRRFVRGGVAVSLASLVGKGQIAKQSAEQFIRSELAHYCADAPYFLKAKANPQNVKLFMRNILKYAGSYENWLETYGKFYTQMQFEMWLSELDMYLADPGLTAKYFSGMMGQ